MSVRVSSASLSRDVMVGLQANLARMQKTQSQLSSGRRINKVSDSPVDAAAAMRLRAEKATNTQVGKNIDDGLSLLGAADSTFTSMSSMLQRVRQLIVQGQNDTLGSDDKAAIAAEIDDLHGGLVALANTTYLGRPIFAGTQDVPAAFDTNTGAYLGNGAAVQRSVSDDGSSRLDVTVTGDKAFTTLFEDGGSAGILERVSTALRDPNGHAALDTELANLDSAMATMQEARSVVGARYNRLLGIQTAQQNRLDVVDADLSTAENIDLPKTIIDMQVQSTAYQAALGAAAKIIQPSLMDFLR